MSIKFGDAVLYLSADQSQLDSDLGEAEGKSKGWLDSVAQGVLQGAGQALFGFVTNGVKMVGDGIGYVLGEAMAAEKVQAQLNAVLKSTGGVAGVTAEAANELAGNLSKVTTFEDDAILSGENLLLTFTGIGKDVFPMATEAMLDISTAMGTDLKSSANMLGKALNDPAAGITALTRVGVVFTEEQKKMIESMVAAGDTAGAQKVILEELNKEFGGSAVAAGETLPGKLEILKNGFGNLAEGIGTGILTSLQPLIDMFFQTANEAMPAVETAIAALVPGVQSIAEWLGTNLPIAFAALSAWWTGTLQPVIAQLVTWFQVNGPIAIQTLVAYWNGTLYPALLGFFSWLQTYVFPVIVILFNWLVANLPGAIQVLTDYWNLVLYPAILAIWGWIQTTLVPMLSTLFTWLQENLPGALQTLSDFWSGTLYPAILAVWTWFSTTLIPMLSTLWTWIGTTLTVALQSLSDYWTKTLKPALETVWKWVNENLIPLFVALQDLFNAGLTLAVMAMATLWEKTLQPALAKVSDYLSATLQPVFEKLIKFWNEDLKPIVDEVSKWFGETISGAFKNVSEAISKVIEWIEALIKKFQEAQNNFPSLFTPGSPTPVELGFRGIASALEEVNRIGLDGLQKNLSMAERAAQPSNIRTTSNQWNLSVFTQEAQATVQNFIEFKAAAGEA